MILKWWASPSRFAFFEIRPRSGAFQDFLRKSVKFQIRRQKIKVVFEVEKGYIVIYKFFDNDIDYQNAADNFSICMSAKISGH